MKIQLSSNKPDAKEICKNQNNTTLPGKLALDHYTT